MPAPTYIISKVADPIFAVFIGLSAAATRINREEKEKGRNTSETFNVGLRQVSLTATHKFWRRANSLVLVPLKSLV